MIHGQSKIIREYIVDALYLRFLFSDEKLFQIGHISDVGQYILVQL